MLTLLDSARHAKTKWPLRQICHNGQWKASSSNAQQYELLLRFCVKHSNKTDQLRAFKALMCAFGKDEVPGSNPGISSQTQSEMTGFLLFTLDFLQDSAHVPAFYRTSCLQTPFSSAFVSVFRPIKSPQTLYFQGLSDFPKISFCISFPGHTRWQWGLWCCDARCGLSRNASGSLRLL